MPPFSPCLIRALAAPLIAALALLFACASGAAAVSPAQAVNQGLEQAASVDLAQVGAAHACPAAAPGYASCQASVLRLRADGALLHPSPRRGRPLQTVTAALAHGGRLAGAPGATMAPTATTATTATTAAAEQAAQSAPGVYTAAWLQQAYDLEGLSATGGLGDTVAIVDVSDDPAAESDLAVFRSSNGLTACTTANGCFEKVNENGAASVPPTSDSG